MRTQEQIDADLALTAAIEKCASVYGLESCEDCSNEQPTMLGDYVVVLEGLKYDDEGQLDMDFYYLLFPNSRLPSAKAKGLLTEGLNLLTFGRRGE